jgi:hypothetical protein
MHTVHCFIKLLMRFLINHIIPSFFDCLTVTITYSIIHRLFYLEKILPYYFIQGLIGTQLDHSSPLLFKKILLSSFVDHLISFVTDPKLAIHTKKSTLRTRLIAAPIFLFSRKEPQDGHW